MLEVTIWKFFEKWMLWVINFWEVDAFLSIWILFPLNFIIKFKYNAFVLENARFTYPLEVLGEI